MKTRVAATLFALSLAPSAFPQPGYAQSVAPPGAASGDTIGVDVTGAVAHPAHLTMTALRGMPSITLAVTQSSERGPIRGQWTGVPLWTVLQQAGLTDTAGKNAAIKHTVLVTGRDGYAVALSWGEIDPDLGAVPALLATARDGQAVPAAEGPRLIVPGDKLAERAVRDVVKLEVR